MRKSLIYLVTILFTIMLNDTRVLLLGAFNYKGATIDLIKYLNTISEHTYYYDLIRKHAIDFKLELLYD